MISGSTAGGIVFWFILIYNAASYLSWGVCIAEGGSHHHYGIMGQCGCGRDGRSTYIFTSTLGEGILINTTRFWGWGEELAINFVCVVSLSCTIIYLSL